MKRPETAPTKLKHNVEFPAWVLTGAVVTLGIIDIFTHGNDLSKTAVSPGAEIAAPPMWAAWGVARGHTRYVKTIYERIQKGLHPPSKPTASRK